MTTKPKRRLAAVYLGFFPLAGLIGVALWVNNPDLDLKLKAYTVIMFAAAIGFACYSFAQRNR